MTKKMLLIVVLAILQGCAENEGEGAATSTAKSMPSNTTTVSTAPTTTVSAAVQAPEPQPTAASSAHTASSTQPAAPSTEATANAAPSSSAAAGGKQFDCGAKGQKPCPMQGWMKSVMATAVQSGDGQKIAQSLSYVAGKAPPGMGSWSAIATDGVAKAKANDIEGAKASCKKCHDLYKEKYKTTMRDRPW